MKPNLIVRPTRGRMALTLLAALALSACAVAPMATNAPVAPVTSAPPPASPYRTLPAPAPTRPAAPVAPVAPATPPAPTYSGGFDARTGLRQSAVVGVSGDASSGYTMMYRPARTEPATVDAAAGKLCGDAGVASSRSNSAGSGSAMPGVQIMIVKCNAA
ncbi:hypothetical protein [Paracoccus zhejiangensis]|uniref:Uncharacterized protein n=1 Tax=Paracoccus zhejiangensis TaxID=1077935 RepID=A0A2H5EV38_9RHOB|nr:hypothetical protein [Paracoccus zhejiangensis]AUH63154.1 hypothetical protein CX676_02440 [Paracoccus zhejiangensis]